MEYATVTAYMRSEMWWQRQGLQQTASGYGSKLATEHMIKVEGRNIWRRVYAICYSNAASFFIVLEGKRAQRWRSIVLELDLAAPVVSRAEPPL
jgi:hypothetical protein